MFVSVLILLSIVLFTLTSPAGAAAQASVDPLSMERWFAGDWLCKGTQQMSPHGPQIPFTDKFVFRMVLDNSWLLFHVDQLEGPNKGKRNLMGSGTWDAGAHLHIRRDMNIGGSRMDVTTPGWDGDRLVFSGLMTNGDNRLAVQQVLTKKTANEYDAWLKMTDDAGATQASEQEVCRRINDGDPKIPGR